MDLLSCATQRLMVVGAKRSGKYTTPYRGAPMSRLGNITEGSQEGAYSPTYPQWCSAMKGVLILFGEVLRYFLLKIKTFSESIFSILDCVEAGWRHVWSGASWWTGSPVSQPWQHGGHHLRQNCRGLQTDFLQDLLRDTTALTHVAFVYQFDYRWDIDNYSGIMRNIHHKEV